MTKSYYENPDYYEEYYNYDGININRIKDIPYDYKGEMGVPITFLDIYNPNQFEITGISNKCIKTKFNHKRISKEEYAYFDNDKILHKVPYSLKEAKYGNSLRIANKDGSPGKVPYIRIIIRLKKIG